MPRYARTSMQTNVFLFFRTSQSPINPMNGNKLTAIVSLLFLLPKSSIRTIFFIIVSVLWRFLHELLPSVDIASLETHRNQKKHLIVFPRIRYFMFPREQEKEKKRHLLGEKLEPFFHINCLGSGSWNILFPPLRQRVGPDNAACLDVCRIVLLV